MADSELRRAALSAAQGIAAKVAVEAFVEQLAQQKPARILDAEFQALMTSPQYVASCCAAYALSIGKTAAGLTDTEKRQAMINFVLEKEGHELSDDTASSPDSPSTG
ncbi:MAG TPA: hypothetical protein VMX14_03745 [Anaerolineae bacterium]|nr:hypothetical protein [Anaerolineae bacterium]HUW13385.1 hypothetical protein [Anaerolineae bacterium]